MRDLVKEIFDLLGCIYDEAYLASLSDDCQVMEYFLDVVYRFLGGNDA